MTNPYFGDFGDVWKHLVLAEVLSLERPLAYWETHAGSARYALTVTTRALAPVFERSGLTQPEAQVPASALAAFSAGTELAWVVEATLPDGRRVTSPAFLVRLE